MKRKRMMAAAMSLMLTAGLVSGCGSQAAPAAQDAGENGGSQTQESQAAQDSADTAAGGDVTVWYYWENEGHQKVLNEIIGNFNESQSEVKVTAKYVPFADFKKQLSIGASANELPDIAILDSPDHASYATMGIFSDLTGKFDVSNYYEATVNSCTIDGKLYGVPLGVNCLSLYYNKDMLDAAGLSVPTTWDELKETAAALSKDNVTGLAFCSLQNEEGTFNFLPWLWSTGASSYEINSEGGIRALGFVKELVDSGAMSKECINWTQGDVMNQFISGNAAMMINGPWQIPTMRQEAPDLNWDVTLIPKDQEYASDIGGENYAVIAGGNEAGALKFLEYATQKEQVEYLMNQMGYISADKTIAAGQFSDDPVMKKFTEQLDYAHARGPLAQWPDVSDAISLAFNQVMTSGATPEDAAAAAQSTIDAVINQ